MLYRCGFFCVQRFAVANSLWASIIYLWFSLRALLYSFLFSLLINVLGIASPWPMYSTVFRCFVGARAGRNRWGKVRPRYNCTGYKITCCVPCGRGRPKVQPASHFGQLERPKPACRAIVLIPPSLRKKILRNTNAQNAPCC